jgi:hypothetical protein
MRLKSGLWVSAYVRRCNVEGVFAAVRRRGAEDAGAIFIKVDRLDGTSDIYGPAPQSAFEEEHPAEIRFDPDVWIIETEDRAGRHFLDRVVR